LIVDYAMPAMDGAEMARRARLRRPSLPIIMITGYAGSADLVLPPGARLLNKPFRVADLHEEIRRVIAAQAELGAG
jgi:CheY-like chemotaxis protein